MTRSNGHTDKAQPPMKLSNLGYGALKRRNLKPQGPRFPRVGEAQRKALDMRRFEKERFGFFCMRLVGILRLIGLIELAAATKVRK